MGLTDYERQRLKRAKADAEYCLRSDQIKDVVVKIGFQIMAEERLWLIDLVEKAYPASGQEDQTWKEE